MAVVALAGIAYAAGASFTHPFTVAADVVTAVALGAAVALTVRTISRDREALTVDRASGRAVIGWSRWWVIWIAPVAAVCAWELYCFVHLPRGQHPTLSALIDMLDSTRVGKTVAFASWLALGWLLAAR
jgi:hypothetical protein